MCPAVISSFASCQNTLSNDHSRCVFAVDNDLQVPCHLGEPKHPKCSDIEQSEVLKYGSDFLKALKPVIDSGPKNGAFITSCVCHGCPWDVVTTGTPGDTKTSYGHYASWHTQHRVAAQSGTDRDRFWEAGGGIANSVHIDTRTPNGGGDLKNSMCMPFP